jgi:hypothetical protein
MKTKQERIIEDIKQTILEESIKTDPDINFMSELIDIIKDIKEETEIK